MASAGLMYFEKRFGEAVADVHKALALAPNSADAVNLASFYLTNSGKAEEAVAASRKAMALNPNYPPNYLCNLGFALRMAGRVEEAIAACRAYDERVPGSGFGLADLAILYRRSGRPDEAADAARRLLAAKPGFTVAAWLKT